ncbi:hypothetical protein Cni_G22237 [Canna indica]|uniref:Endonuclease/exonuclease/phosphatase domain-containing protein n=1 Tax=Canna indica TaxID=4628 RepID=A0AAQ3KQZ4_9LILI|nr:hypothetical protein Cni_G22237 [Canna indica]
MLIWNKNVFEINCVYKNDQYINVIAKHFHGMTCLIPGTNYRKSKVLWDIYKELEVEQLSWVIVGDMNCIRKRSEKMGGRDFFFSKVVNDFNYFIEEKVLLEAKHTGIQFTWTNNKKREARIVARLDRVLYNEECINRNYEIKVKHLQRVDFDHRPMLIFYEKRRKKRKGETSFIFEHFWFEQKDFRNIVKENWVGNRM